MRPARRNRWGRISRPLIPVFFLSTFGATWAQGDGLEVRRSSRTGRVICVAAQDGQPITARDGGGVASVVVSPENFLDRFGSLFGLVDRKSQLINAAIERDLSGHTHSKFKQIHEGVQVFGGQLRIHQDDQGRVIAANGHFFALPVTLGVQPDLPAETAGQIASEEFDSGNATVRRVELVIVDPGWYGDPPAGARLAYLVELEDPQTWNAESFFVDAMSGKILDRWSLMERARVRQIYDGKQTTALPGVLVRTETSPALPFPIDANRAFHYFGDTYDYFWRAFRRDSMNNSGMAMVATVDSIAPGCPNAFWSSSLKQMAFCTGTVTDDITAHELTHGVTHFTAQLIYQNQSGQLNESFSDVFGELVDLFNGNAAFAIDDAGPAWPTHVTGPGLDELNSLRAECSPNSNHYDGVRWLMGEDAYAFGGALRDMWDPTCHFDPDRALSPLQTCGPGDNGGVHSGSGIPNHAFAMLVDGKEFNGYTVRGIGPIKAGAVWYHALTAYLTPTSDFEDAYLAFTRSAHDLIGQYPLDPRTGFPSYSLFTTDDAVQVERALRAVEMDGPGRCGQTVPIVTAAPPPGCGDEVVLFSDNFESGSVGWSVANSGPPTPYNWQVTNTLPLGRRGTAWVGEDRNIGDCADSNESGSHSLISPPIMLPRSIQHPLLRFTHHVDTETGWDGGLISVSVNGGRWEAVPGSSFHFNSYNTRLRRSSPTNLNPLGGREAWSGIGAEWGTSVADLSGFARGGDTLQIRFDFGKDGCTGRVGWFVDDVEVYACPDCNFNDQSDDADVMFWRTSGALSDIGVGSPRRFVVPAPPKASEDVTFRFSAIADLAAELGDENLFVSMNGSLLGEIFVGNASDCPSTPNSDKLTVPREQFNQAACNGSVILDITATESVNPTLCGGTSWVRIDVGYKTTSLDQDADGIPDECQGCQAVQAPSLAPGILAMNRYIAFVPASGNRHVAYRVRRLEQPAESPNVAPAFAWVGPAGTSLGSFYRAGLQCRPHFSNEWGKSDAVFVRGNFISPGYVYVVDAIDLGCWPTVQQDDQPALTSDLSETHFSKAARVATTPRWGDIVGKENSGPDGIVDVRDVSAVVDRFKNLPGAVELHRADVSPAIPDGVVDFSDISRVLDAYRGEPYPFSSQSMICSQRSR